MTTALVMAKAPVPGRVKTRLMSVFTAEEAAALAEAALVDTLDAARACSAIARVVLALDGEPGPWLPDGVDVIPQDGGDFGARLANAWAAMDGPTVQVGMDTPQVDAKVLLAASSMLCRRDAVLGLAADGGWWALGLVRPVPGVFDGIPMSTSETGARQLARLRGVGLDVGLLPELRDVDTPEDARLVSSGHPTTRFARVHASLLSGERHPLEDGRSLR